MMSRTVFMGGVHGVGKTFFCQKVVAAFDVEHVTASSLISRHTRHKNDKTVSNVKKNQSILAEELNQYRPKHPIILLDGHFCLIGSDLSVKEIPLETFESISPSAIILLVDDPEMIVERLAVRDAHIHSIDLLSKLQSSEKTRASLVSEHLKIPLTVIETQSDIEDSIQRIAPYLQI